MSLKEIQDRLGNQLFETLLPVLENIAKIECPDGVRYFDHRFEGIEQAVAATLAIVAGTEYENGKFGFQVISRDKLVQDEGMEYLALHPSLFEDFHERFSEIRLSYLKED